MVWVRVAGRGSFQNSPGLKAFAEKMTAAGLREFVIDLKECELMDSTFMGTLAGIGLRLGDTGHIRIIRANPRNRQVLANLGLDRILAIADTAPAPLPEAALRDAAETHPGGAERDTIIEAHENLAAAHPENAVRFKDVIEFLKQQEPGETGSH